MTELQRNIDFTELMESHVFQLLKDCSCLEVDVYGLKIIESPVYISELSDVSTFHLEN